MNSTIQNYQMKFNKKIWIKTYHETINWIYLNYWYFEKRFIRYVWRSRSISGFQAHLIFQILCLPTILTESIFCSCNTWYTLCMRTLSFSSNLPKEQSKSKEYISKEREKILSPDKMSFKPFRNFFSKIIFLCIFLW